jgi:hypothetical protein
VSWSIAARPRSVACAFTAALSLFACSNDDSTAAAALTGPPVLTIDQLASPGGPVVTSPQAGACVQLGKDPNKTLVITVGQTNSVGQLINWTMAPPFGCVGAPQCGYLRATVTDAAGTPIAVDAVGTVITVPLAALADAPGTITIRVELLDDQGKLATNSQGSPFAAATLDVQLQALCGAPPPDGGHPPEAGPTDAAIRPDAPLSVPDAAPSDASTDASKPPNPDSALPDSGVLPDSPPPPDASTDAAATG